MSGFEETDYALHLKWEQATLPLQLQRLRREHETGIPNARHEALRLCVRNSVPLPGWLALLLDLDAAVALDQACYIKTPGAHTARKRCDEIWQKQMIKAALIASKRAGLKGDQRFEKAAQMLAEFKIYRDIGTLRSPKLPYAPTTGQYEPFRKKLGLLSDLYGFLCDDEDDEA